MEDERERERNRFDDDKLDEDDVDNADDLAEVDGIGNAHDAVG